MVREFFVLWISILMCSINAENDVDETRDINEREQENQQPLIADILQNDQNDVVRFEDEEPGFDLTDEEKIKFKIWPRGVIPYFIDTFSFDKGFRDMLRQFLKKSEHLTRLHFRELENMQLSDGFRYVFFINRRGVLECQDYTTINFTNEGVQRVVIGYDCFSDGVGPGSLILALAGVPPMHRAPDRDKYIQVDTKNALPDKVHLYDKLSDSDWLFHDSAYDWYSAGHYTWHKYTINGFATIAPKRLPSKTYIPLKTGEFKQLSGTDIWKIQMLYSYKSKKGPAAEKSQCDKLFRPGDHFSSYVAKSDDELTPRAKPNKYLGITETVLEKTAEDMSAANADANNDPLEGSNNENLGKRIRLYETRVKTQDPIFEQSDFDTKEKEDRMIQKYRIN